MPNSTKANKAIFDRSTGTTVTIAAESLPATESFARSIQAAFASHNTSADYQTAMNSLIHRPLADEWLLIGMDVQRAIQQRTGLEVNIQETQTGLRATAADSAVSSAGART